MTQRNTLADQPPVRQIQVGGRSDRGAEPVVVAVRATDPGIGAEVVARLRARPDIYPVPAERAHHAHVILVLADTFRDDLLAWMQRAADRLGGPGKKECGFVLVADELRPAQLQRAAAYGPVSVLSSRIYEYEDIAGAILGVRQRRVMLPAALFRALVDGPRPAEPAAALPGMATAPPWAGAGLDGREREVLRLLADGFGTNEIAERLNYSERTVKNILHRFLSRMNLRNRTHAVAYAMQNGLL
jgi:DNA-binding NarL/FixJ family response regulator